MSFVLAIIYIQLAKIYEYQADNYSATRMDHPEAMISGNLKMKKTNKTLDGNRFLARLFVIAVPYEERIAIAKKEVDRRKNLLHW